MQILLSLLFLLAVYLPTFVANAVPVMAKNIPFLASWTRPVCEKHLGKNKTYRGLVTWVIGGILTAWAVFFLMSILPTEWYTKYSLIFPSLSLALLWGGLQGFWALFGDMTKSFLKRKVGKKPWSPWPFWDGVDYIIGSLLFFAPIYMPQNLWQLLFLIFFAPSISLIANTFSYLMGWKEVRY